MDSPLRDESIFLSQRSTDKDIATHASLASPDIAEIGLDIEEGIEVDVEDIYRVVDIDSTRFNELGGPIKKRKTSIGSLSRVAASDGETSASVAGGDGKSMALGLPCSPNSQDSIPTKSTKKAKPKKSRPKGPFLADSDTEDEL